MEHTGLLRRWWSRALDGRRVWGSLDIRPDRYGVMRYRLLVYPPGINTPQRHRLRLWRGWPLWGALLWMVCEIWLSEFTGPWLTLFLSTSIYVGSGLVTRHLAHHTAGATRTVCVMVMPNDPDRIADTVSREITVLGRSMIEADERYERGEISAVDHEMTWWRVYHGTQPAAVAQSNR